MTISEPLTPDEFIHFLLTHVEVSEHGVHARILPREFSLDHPEPVIAVTLTTTMSAERADEVRNRLATEWRSICEASPTSIAFDIDQNDEEPVLEGVVTWRREPFAWDDLLAYYRGTKSALERERAENRELNNRLGNAERFVDRTIDRHEKLMAARPDMSENLDHRIRDLRSVRTVLEKK